MNKTMKSKDEIEFSSDSSFQSDNSFNSNEQEDINDGTKNLCLFRLYDLTFLILSI